MEGLLNDLTWKDYPIATAIHWGQGLLAGWLLAQAHWKRHWHLIGYALLATLCFISYEALEQYRIGDRGDVDVLNFTVMLHVAAALTSLYHAIRRLFSRCKQKSSEGQRPSRLT